MAVADILPALFDGYFIKMIFLTHAGLMALGTIAMSWSGGGQISYIAYSSIFLLILLLSILVDKNADIMLTATTYDTLCIVLDIIYLVIHPYIGLFATLVVVVNLLCRPLSAILLLKNYSARAGVDDPTGGLLEVNVQNVAPRARSAYQNIDEPNQTLP